MKIYVNGTEESLTHEVNNLSSSTQNTADFTLGSRNGAYSFFKGSLDEVWVYDRVLSSDEITLLARDGGLIAYYPFNTNANDESGNSYDGTVSGATFIYNDPVNGDMASFDGSDDYITSDVPDFDYHDPFSVSFQVKSLSTSISTSQEVFVGKLEYGGNERGWAVLRRFDHPNKLSFILRNQISSSEIRLTTVNDIFTDQSRKYIIVTYDGSGNGSGVKVYVNGTEESLNLEVDNLSGTTVNTGAFSIGSRDNAYSFFNGYIDEVRVYDRVMCSEEIVEYGSPVIIDNVISGSYLESDLSVYPNPNTGKFLVDFTMLSDECRVSVTNNLGQTFYSAQWKEPKGKKVLKEIEAAIETPGVYYLVLNMKEGTVSRKIIVR